MGMLTNLICSYWAIKETKKKFETFLRYKIYGKTILHHQYDLKILIFSFFQDTESFG